MTHFVLSFLLLFQAKPVPAQTPAERAIRANYEQWRQAYKQKRFDLIKKTLAPKFVFKDIDGETSDQRSFGKYWFEADTKENDAITGKIVIYKIQPYGKQMRAVVDVGYWQFKDYWQKVGGTWKLSKRDMFGSSAAQNKQVDEDHGKK
jgi:RimJ/RimL family protein N-acetyltransferase